MKKIFALFISALLTFELSAQNFSFEHLGSRSAPVKKARFANAKKVSDFVPPPGCRPVTPPYSAVEIIAVVNGITKTERAAYDALSDAQHELMMSADQGSDVIVKLIYPSKSGEQEDEYWFTPGPDVEASYPGGDQELNNYLKPVVADISSREGAQTRTRVMVSFVVDEQGNIRDLRLMRSSLDAFTDKSILNAIRNMPRWKPAEQGKTPVKQSIAMSVGPVGC